MPLQSPSLPVFQDTSQTSFKRPLQLDEEDYCPRKSFRLQDSCNEDTMNTTFKTISAVLLQDLCTKQQANDLSFTVELQKTSEAISPPKQQSIDTFCQKSMEKSSDEKKEQKTAEQISSQKLKMWRNLLPPALSQNLSYPYERMLKIASVIDAYLIAQKIGMMDCFENIQNHIKSELKVLIQFSLIKKILGVCSDHYKVWSDPLKTIVIGIPDQKPSLVFRQRKIRLSLHAIAADRALLGEPLHSVVNNLSEFEPQILKTGRFYPKKESSLSGTISERSSKIKESFLIKLEKFIDDKEKRAEINTDEMDPWTLISPGQFCSQLESLFKDYKVTHMFKASLVELMAKRTCRSWDCVAAGIQAVRKCGKFLTCPSNRTNYRIYSMRAQEKDAALEELRKK